jgi:hypothetical protein
MCSTVMNPMSIEILRSTHPVALFDFVAFDIINCLELEGLGGSMRLN